jgi:hypothetical protein
MVVLWGFLRRRRRGDDVSSGRGRVVVTEEDLDGLAPQEVLDLVRAIERGEDFRVSRRGVGEGLYIGDVRDSLGNYLGSYLHPKSDISHVAVFGSTGMGKSTLLGMFARHLMLSGEGVTVFDPHGELARDILSLVPSSRRGDVIFIDPAFFESVGKVIRVNPLEYDVRDPSSRERAAQDFMTPLRKLYAEFWGPRLERILYHAMKLLLSFPPGEVQLLDLYDLIMNQKRREELILSAREYGLDPATERFWLYEFSGYKEEAVQAVLTKITQLLSNEYASMIFNSETGHSDIDFHEVLNQRKILVVSTPIGVLRELPAQFISSFIITRYFLAAMERINVAGENATSFPDHWIIIDEAHVAESQALIDIMTQARKYKLHVILATQYPSQFSKEVRDAILNNASIIITFRNGPEAAEDLAHIFQLRVNEWERIKLEIMNLPKYVFLAKFQNDTLPRTLYTTNVKEMLREQLADWLQVATQSMELYAKELHREYYYMPLLSREAIIMLGQYLFLSGMVIQPQYVIDRVNFLRFIDLKLQQEKLTAKSDDALLELRTHEILIPKEDIIIPGKMLKRYLETIENTEPIAKPTILKHIFNSFIYIPQKTQNLLTPDIIIDKRGRKKTGIEEQTGERNIYIYIQPTSEDREKIQQQKTRYTREKKPVEIIILDKPEEQPYDTKQYEKIKNIQKELTALTIIFKNALKEPLDEETLTRELSHILATIVTPTTLTPALEQNETQAILETLKNSGMITNVEIEIINQKQNIIIPTKEAIKEYYIFTPSPKSALKSEHAYLIQKTMHLIYTDELKITKTLSYLQPHKHEPYTSAPDITMYILTLKGYQPFYALEIETEKEQNQTQILTNYYKNTARNQKVIFITDTQEKEQKIRNILKTEGIQLPSIITLPQTEHDEQLQQIYKNLETPEKDTQQIKEQLAQYYINIIHKNLKEKQHKLMKTTIITALQNIYNTLKNPTQKTRQLLEQTIITIENTENPTPLQNIKIEYNKLQNETYFQQKLQEIINTLNQQQETQQTQPTEEKQETTQPTTTQTTTTQPSEQEKKTETTQINYQPQHHHIPSEQPQKTEKEEKEKEEQEKITKLQKEKTIKQTEKEKPLTQEEPSEHIDDFIKEACIIDENERVEKKELYQAYKNWAEKKGITPLGKIQFYKEIEKRYTEEKTKEKYYIKGLKTKF